MVSYQRMYCLVPCLEFSKSVPVCGQLSAYVLFVPFLEFSRSVPVCGQLSTYVLFGAVS